MSVERTDRDPPRIAGPVAHPKAPRERPPKGAWDTHAHIFGPSDRFPYTPGRGYTPLGPWIETEVADPEAIDMLVRVNGELRAASNTARLQSTVAESIAYATSWLELGAGDVIMTGAPATFVPVEPGDLIELDFPGIGTLSNPVIEERS